MPLFFDQTLWIFFRSRMITRDIFRFSSALSFAPINFEPLSTSSRCEKPVAECFWFSWHVSARVTWFQNKLVTHVEILSTNQQASLTSNVTYSPTSLRSFSPSCKPTGIPQSWLPREDFGLQQQQQSSSSVPQESLDFVVKEPQRDVHISRQEPVKSSFVGYVRPSLS